VLAWTTDGDVELRSERLLLRAPRRTDVGVLDEAIQETLDELVRWLPWARPGHRRADSRQYIRHARLARSQRVAMEYVLLSAQTGQLLGMASLHRLDWPRRCAGLGYWVRRSAWGQGIATEAGSAVVEQAFHRLDLHRVEAYVATGNRASQRVVEKLGFTREGIARELEFVNGRYLDHVQYSILRRDLGGAFA
jgi:RimJ/RimL family protein N-acetyltransferase